MYILQYIHICIKCRIVILLSIKINLYYIYKIKSIFIKKLIIFLIYVYDKYTREVQNRRSFLYIVKYFCTLSHFLIYTFNLEIYRNIAACLQLSIRAATYQRSQVK